MVFINHDLKAIYVPIPKTGSSYVRNILKKYYDFKYIKPKLFNNEGHSVDKTPTDKKYLLSNSNFLSRYMSSESFNVMNNMDETKWKTYKKFTIIRYPYDRIISAYCYCTDNLARTKSNVSARHARSAVIQELNHMSTNKPPEFVNLKEYLLRHTKKESYTNKYDMLCYMHSIIPQTDHLIDINNEMNIDYIGTFENLNEDLCDILINLGVKDIRHTEELLTSKKVNETTRENYIDYYDEPTLELVNQICEIDFANFNQYTIKKNIDELKKEDYYVDDTKLMSKNQDLLKKLNENKHINIVTTDIE